MATPLETLGQFRIPPGIAELYEGRKVSCFFDVRPSGREGIMVSHQQAAAYFLDLSLQHQNAPLVVTALAPMAGGKSTVLGLVAEQTGNFQAFKHTFDVQRVGSTEIINHSRSVRTPARTYHDVTDILDQLGPQRTVLIDELQFAQNSGPQITEFITELEDRGKHALLLGLNLTFARLTWVTTSAASKRADFNILLAAKCAENGCLSPALFTQRKINGAYPHADDPLVIIGDVGKDQEYDPVCFDHHVVLPPRSKSVFEIN